MLPLTYFHGGKIKPFHFTWTAWSEAYFLKNDRFLPLQGICTIKGKLSLAVETTVLHNDYFQRYIIITPHVLFQILFLLINATIFGLWGSLKSKKEEWLLCVFFFFLNVTKNSLIYFHNAITNVPQTLSLKAGFSFTFMLGLFFSLF